MTSTETEVLRIFVSTQLYNVPFSGTKDERWDQYLSLRLAFEQQLAASPVPVPWMAPVVGVA